MEHVHALIWAVILCKNGYPELDSCLLCKNDYYTHYNFIDKKSNCKCKIDNCKICSNNICIKCDDNYYYDNKTKSCAIKNVMILIVKYAPQVKKIIVLNAKIIII